MTWSSLILLSLSSAAGAATSGEFERHYRGESESLRRGKQAGFDAGFGLRSQMREGKLGFSLFLDPNTVLQFNLFSLRGDINEETDMEVDGDRVYLMGVKTKLKGSAVSGLYKRFFGNSFYAGAGLDFSKVEGTYYISRDVLGTDDNLETDLGHYAKTSLDLRIGNQWQWNNFTLGTDWVGLLLPLNVEKEFKNAAANSGETLDSIEEFQDGADAQLTVTRFYAGWNF